MRALLSGMLSLFVFTSSAFCEGADEHFLGEWGGIQPALTERGIQLDTVLTLDSLHVANGGAERGSAIIGNVDVTATVDTEKLGLWSDGTVFLYALGNFGDSITDLVGDRQVTSNIEAFNTFKLYEAWYEHHFFGDRAALLLGLYDYNSEFDSLDNASNLINSSFGIGVDISQVGPSIFSTTSLAARLRLLPSEETYLLTTVYDGVPGDPERPDGTRVRFDSGDGVFVGAEVGWSVGEAETYRKLGLGGWYHTKDFEDINGKLRDSNGGGYLLAEANLTQMFGFFLRFGLADPNRNEIARYLGGGTTVHGLIPGRDDDVLSLGVASAMFSNDAQDANNLQSAETTLEINYRIQVSPFFAFSPDMQFIFNPSGDREIEDAVELGFRTELAL